MASSMLEKDILHKSWELHKNRSRDILAKEQCVQKVVEACLGVNVQKEESS
jgi:hypothetical protein